MNVNFSPLQRNLRFPSETILLKSQEPNVEELPNLWSESVSTNLIKDEEFEIWFKNEYNKNNSIEEGFIDLTSDNLGENNIQNNTLTE
jgi:hypothetical protein